MKASTVALILYLLGSACFFVGTAVAPGADGENIFRTERTQQRRRARSLISRLLYLTGSVYFGTGTLILLLAGAP